jgi:hypothetical protein
VQILKVCKILLPAAQEISLAQIGAFSPASGSALKFLLQVAQTVGL